MIKKIIFLILLLFSSTGCYIRSKSYFYKTNPNDIKLFFHKYLYISAYLVNDNAKNNPISSIKINPINFANLKKSEKVELLSDKILVEYKGNNYNLEVFNKRAVYPYDEGVILTEDSIIVHFGKVKIDDKFIIDLPPIDLKDYFMHFGKVKIDDKFIIDLPPIDLKDYFMVKVVSYNPILDALDKDTSKLIYHGPVKDYKGR